MRAEGGFAAAMRTWWRALRPFSFGASAVPVAVGALAARHAGEAFSWARLGWTLLAGVSLHAAANLWDDWFDYRCGVDRPGADGGSGVLTSGLLRPGQVFAAACIFALAGGAVGAALAVSAKAWGVLALGAAGGAGAAGYAAGRWSPKHLALGEAWVALLMGAGLPLGAWWVQTGHPAWRPVAAAFPLATLTALFLHANNLRDREGDETAGVATLAAALARRFSVRTAIRFARGLAAAAFLGLAALVAAGAVPRWAGLAGLTLPGFVAWGASLSRKGGADDASVRQAAALQLAFGVFFLAGYFF
jgi:1,4-dihydroxy-2-naphthoate octaprenyltransferase